MDPVNHHLLATHENSHALTTNLQKLPIEITVIISKNLCYNEMLALALTSKTFYEKKAEFLKVSGYHQLQIKKNLMAEEFRKKMDALLSEPVKSI